MRQAKRVRPKAKRREGSLWVNMGYVVNVFFVVHISLFIHRDAGGLRATDYPCFFIFLLREAQSLFKKGGLTTSETIFFDQKF